MDTATSPELQTLTPSPRSQPTYVPFLMPMAILIAGLLISATLFYTRGYEAGPKKPKLAVQKNDIVVGNPRAKVIVYEYTDFQCPFCRKFFVETWPQLKQQYLDTGKIRLVVRHYPLDFHPMAATVAIAAECSKEQGKFIEFHDAVFGGQVAKDPQKFSKTIAFTQTELDNWITAAGLDQDTLKACVNSGKYDAKINNDISTATALGVRGTPSFFIGDELIEGAYDFKSYSDAIEKLL